VRNVAQMFHQVDFKGIWLRNEAIYPKFIKKGALEASVINLLPEFDTCGSKILRTRDYRKLPR